MLILECAIPCAIPKKYNVVPYYNKIIHSYAKKIVSKVDNCVCVCV